MRRGRVVGGWLGRFGTLALAAVLAACSQQRAADAPLPPPVGHYVGSLARPGQPDVSLALDLRHPSSGHYEAELTAPTAPGLNFVADSVVFRQNTLRLTRPGRPGQTLTLALAGDFWRGTLALDTLYAEALLVKRGPPDPSTYRVEEFPQPGGGSAWRYAPADTSTAGPALALLPDAATAAAAPLWADALARNGFVVLLLPPTDSTSLVLAAGHLRMSLRRLRATAGADPAHLGVWAAGRRAGTMAEVLAADSIPVAFFVAQNVELTAAAKAAFHHLGTHKLPVLGLFGGSDADLAGALRGVLGRRGTVLLRRAAGADLLVPGPLGPTLGPGLPGAVAEWLRGQQERPFSAKRL